MSTMRAMRSSARSVGGIALRTRRLNLADALLGGRHSAVAARSRTARRRWQRNDRPRSPWWCSHRLRVCWPAGGPKSHARSIALGTASAAVLKLAFARARPAQSNHPNDWFQGRGHNSFPSGEVAAVASAVTPFVLEYGSEHPAVYALELLPAYVAVARVKAQAHCQSDMIAAFALGTAIGYYSHRRTSSLSVGVLPGAVTIGWRTRF